MRNAECGMKVRPSGPTRVSRFRIPNSALRTRGIDARSAHRMRAQLFGGPQRRDHRGTPHGARKVGQDRKSTRLNSSHLVISYAVFCLKKKKSIKASRLSTQDYNLSTKSRYKHD